MNKQLTVIIHHCSYFFDIYFRCWSYYIAGSFTILNVSLLLWSHLSHTTICGLFIIHYCFLPHKYTTTFCKNQNCFSNVSKNLMFILCSNNLLSIFWQKKVLANITKWTTVTMIHSCNNVYPPVLPNGSQKHQCICHFKFVKFIYISMLPAGCICIIIFLSTVTFIIHKSCIYWDCCHIGANSKRYAVCIRYTLQHYVTDSLWYITVLYSKT